MLHCILCSTDTLSLLCNTVFFVTQILYHFRVTLYSLLHRYFITFLLHCILCYIDTLSVSFYTVFFVTQILYHFLVTLYSLLHRYFITFVLHCILCYTDTLSVSSYSSSGTRPCAERPGTPDPYIDVISTKTQTRGTNSGKPFVFIYNEICSNLGSIVLPGVLSDFFPFYCYSVGRC